LDLNGNDWLRAISAHHLTWTFCEIIFTCSENWVLEITLLAHLQILQDLLITYENLQSSSVDQTDVTVKQLLATSNEAASLTWIWECVN
jgi:hypothetical protein